VPGHGQAQRKKPLQHEGQVVGRPEKRPCAAHPFRLDDAIGRRVAGEGIQGDADPR